MAKAKKLPSGNYRVQVSKTIDGRLVRKSFTAPDRRKAELAAAEWVANQTELAAVENITLRQAYDRYISSKENVLSPATVRTYRTMANTSLSDIMHLPIESLSLNILQRSINIYAANHQPKGVRNCAALLSAVMAMFRPDFNVRLTLPQKKKAEMYIPDDEDIKKLLEIISGTRLEVPVLLAAFGPMRRGEICALTSNDINGNIITVNKAMVKGPDNNWIIKAPKTYSSYRQIEFPDFVIEKLKGIEGNITDMTPASITDAFLKLLRKNGLPEYRFHDLRHYAVSTLHSINVPDKYIMARGGWSTNHTMNTVYNHTLKSKTDSIEQKINSHFSDVFSN